MPLRPYSDVHKPLDSVPSGVACSEMLCALCKRSHSITERPLEWWNQNHEVHAMPCPGEMCYNQPEEEHPQLKGLRKATCDWCGWQGWC